MNYDFMPTSQYDKDAYTALSEASWQLFRKPMLIRQSYPILIAMILLPLLSLAIGWNTYEPNIRIGLGAIAGFCALAIPASSVTTRLKMRSIAIKDAKRRGSYPSSIPFVFSQNTILATVDDQPNTIGYDKITSFHKLGDWRFIFFGQAAYIFHRDFFADAQELSRFEAFVTEKSGHALETLKGNGPARTGKV